MFLQINIESKDETREEVVFMTKDDFEALISLHKDLVEEDFSITGVQHECRAFDITVEWADDEEDIYEDDITSVEEAIEILNSF